MRRGFTLLAAGLLALCVAAPAAGNGRTGGAAGEARVGISVDGADPELTRRLLLDPGFSRTSWSRAQVMWQVGDPGRVRFSQMLERVRQGAGLVLVAGRRLPDLSPLGLAPVRQEAGRVTLAVGRGNINRALTDEVVWPTAPQAARRWVLTRGPTCSLRPLVTDKGTNDPVMLVGRLGRGRIAVVSLQLLHASNRELTLWPYFNYLLYALTSRAAAREAAPFMAWTRAPVPGPRMRTALVAGLGVAWLLTVLLFLRVRAYSRRHPDVPDRFFAQVAESKGGAPRPEGENRWRSIGFARSLAGFLTLAGTLFVLFAPYYYVTNILIPNDVQPFPQAKGIWGFVWEALQIAWFLFDAGTYVAFVKYFAEYRIKNPREAVLSAQFFVWWQILTGLFQVTMACIVVIFILPGVETLRPYGYTSNFIILVALGQYPGIFAVMNFFFQAYQRYDYNIGLDLLSDWVLRFGLQIPFVLLFRAWGAANPEYGEAFGAAVGIGLGFYFSQVVTFAVGTILYKRLGLKLAPLFMAHFDLTTAKRMLRYGLQVVMGKAFFRAAKFVDRFVISILLLNYTEWLGLEDQIHYNLMFLFPIAYRFFETAMAALSESHGNGKQTLTRYYLVRFFQIGSLYTAIALSLFLALGPYFVRHAMDPQWSRAADFMIIAAIAGAFSAAAWLSDMLQKGAGRPDLFAYILGAEQALRIGLFWILIPRYQFWGFYFALLITVALKVTVAWIINHLVVVRLRLFLWQMLAAPVMAGVANFFLLRLAGGALGLTGRWEVIILFFVSALVSFFVCFFATGLFGGMDRAFVDELEQASRMTGVLRPLTRLFYHAARAGCVLSPLYDRFPVTLHAEAMQEARDLERQRDG